MLVYVVYGLYRFGQKRRAYRNDFCLVCQQERVSVRTRSFHTAHLYYIPLAPIGFRNEWWCTACNKSPDTGAAAKALVGLVSRLALLGALGSAIVAWSHPALLKDVDFSRGRLDGLMPWLVPWVLALVAYVVFLKMPIIDHEAIRKQATPSSETNCALCNRALVTRENDGVVVKHCRSCALDRAV